MRNLIVNAVAEMPKRDADPRYTPLGHRQWYVKPDDEERNLEIGLSRQLKYCLAEQEVGGRLNTEARRTQSFSPTYSLCSPCLCVFKPPTNFRSRS